MGVETVSCQVHNNPECVIVAKAPESTEFNQELMERGSPGLNVVRQGERSYAVFGSALHGRVVYQLSEPMPIRSLKGMRHVILGTRIA